MAAVQNWKRYLVAILPVALCAAALLLSTSAGSNWNQFRGPNGSGVAQAEGLPLQFGPDQNVIWAVSVPSGHSSPVLDGERIFLTAVEEGQLWTLCLERGNGQVLWRRQAPRQRHEKLDSRNNPASPSPALDAAGNVYVFFADFGLLSYTNQGEERWRLPMGPFDNSYGMGASPVLAEDKVLLVCDQQTGSYLIAVGKEDGKVAWKVDRPEAKSGHSTPIVYKPSSGASQLLVPGSFQLNAYDVQSGKKVWWVNGLSFEMKSTPVMGDGMVFVNGYATPLNQPDRMIQIAPFEEVLAKSDKDGDGKLSKQESPDNLTKNFFDFLDLNKDGFLDQGDWQYFRAAMATKNGMLGIRLGGQGDMSETNLVWQYHKSVPQLPSPLLYRGVLYMINDGGIATSFEPATGKEIARGRIRGAIDKYYASPVAGDGKIFLLSETCKAAVLGTDGSLEVLAVNDLGSSCYATPAIDQGRIYIRTQDKLYAFGKRKESGIRRGGETAEFAERRRGGR